MAVGHLSYNTGSTYGMRLTQVMASLRDYRHGVADLIAMMAQMIDGDGSQSAHFAYVTSRFGFSNDAASKAAWDELNAVNAKLTTDASVLNVNAAINQVLAKFSV